MEQSSTSAQTLITAYPVSNYNFGAKAAKLEKDRSTQERLSRMEDKYRREGIRRSVEAVILVHDHNHPHVLLLQLGSAFFKLPGGRLRPGEDDREGLRRKLTTQLSPEAASLAFSWDVADCIGIYWRPNFDVSMYPYLPAHITRPKEVKKIFLVPLPEKCYLAIPRNFKIVAVPLFDLYENSSRYGAILASLPGLLSRFRLTLAGATISPADLEAREVEPSEEQLRH
ncbi:g1586 [Coccomyxa viridis]|uniref:Pre-mRNA cleavage factor Im 25 kDa subunit n=1 Tax=Coccomyxa viridis TaxID=1274662 RepID=A0ABP1FIC0_9CHLO